MVEYIEEKKIFNPNRQELSIYLDEYLNEISPITENLISYDATYKLVRKHVDGVSYHDITRAIRYFSPTYMISFENYIEVLKIFKEEQENYRKKAETSIKNILIQVQNKDPNVIDKVVEIINSFRQKAEDESSFDRLPIINSIQKLIDNPKEQIKPILESFLPIKKETQKIYANFAPKDFKLHIYLQDLFNISKCIKFLDIFKKYKKPDIPLKYLPLKIGFSVECIVNDISKFSRVIFMKPLDVFSDNKDIDKEIYYRINDNITLDFKINIDEAKKESMSVNDYYAILLNSPIICKLYTIIIPNKVSYHPMKFLYGYLKIPIVPILFAHDHEIHLSGNFIPLEKNFTPSQFERLVEFGANSENIKEDFSFSEESNKKKNLEAPVMITFSVMADSDPFICFSEPYGKNIEMIDGIDITKLRKMTIMNSESRTCQISALDELGQNQHFLCFYVNSNVEFDTDDLVDMLIRDARKPGQNYSDRVRSPAVLFYNQDLNYDYNSNLEYNGIMKTPFPLRDSPEMISDLFKIFEKQKNEDFVELKFQTKLTQLERCIFLCAALIKDEIPSFVCCGSVDMCDSCFVISLIEEASSMDENRYVHLIPGHVYPISLLPYSIKQDEDKDADKRPNSLKNLRIANMSDFDFISHVDEYKKYKYVHVWCLSEVENDLVPSSFHVTSIFNDKNVWINRQQNTSLIRINWDIANQDLWFPVLIPNSNDASNYVYSKRKVTFLESFDKDKYELYFEYELQQYIEENAIQVNQTIHKFLNEKKKDLFNNEVIIDHFNHENDGLMRFFFFRKIEAPYFLMPDELLEYLIKNHGLRYFQSFDVVIDFTPLPLKNCKIDIIIAYNSEFFISKEGNDGNEEMKNSEP